MRDDLPVGAAAAARNPGLLGHSFRRTGSMAGCFFIAMKFAL
jgi:hypothetical protein